MIVFLVVLLTALVWVLEAAVEVLLIPDRSFMGGVYSAIELHEVYMRLLVIVVVAGSFILLVVARRSRRSEAVVNNVLNGAIPICITNRDFNIMYANEAYREVWGDFENEPVKCYQNRPGSRCHTDNCPLTNIVNGIDEYECESEKEIDGETRYFMLTARPYLSPNNKIEGAIESFQEITARKQLEDEKADLIEQLREALEKTKLLSGLLPVCSACKKIRDDDGYWQQIEGYISHHSEAEFTHGICPDCMNELYPDYSEEE